MKKEDLLDLAILSKLEIKEDEIDEFLKDMVEIISFADKINSVEVDEHNLGEINQLQNVFRKDEVLESFSQEEILKNSKTVEDGFFYLKNKEHFKS